MSVPFSRCLRQFTLPAGGGFEPTIDDAVDKEDAVEEEQSSGEAAAMW